MHRAALVMGPSGFVAVLAGWITTEVGRQPYTVYGLLTTAQSVSPIQAPAVGASLVAFILVYFALFGAGVFYILRLMRPAAMPAEPDLPPEEPIRASRHHARAGHGGKRHVRRRSEERGMELDLPFIWAGLIAFAVLAYVVLDGFDLGVGILFPFVAGRGRSRPDDELGGPVWDGNETWLVLGGGGLFAVFPLAYAVIMPALYAPIIVMLLGLIFRGVAFEFRWKTRRGKFLWDWAFAGGSTLAAFAQGIALGALVQGIPVADRAYAGGWWDWLTPFSLLTGVALVVGYALLGATWLIWKTEGEVQQRAYDFAMWPLGPARIVLIGAGQPVDAVPQRRLHAALVRAGRSCSTPPRSRCWWRPRRSSCSAASGTGTSAARSWRHWPCSCSRYHRPRASASTRTSSRNSGDHLGGGRSRQQPGASCWSAPCVLIPLILAYTAYSYWVFRGKVNAAGGYH